MASHQRKHTHKRSSSLPIEQVPQLCPSKEAHSQNAFRNETLYLLEQSQKNCEYQLIVDTIEPKRDFDSIKSTKPKSFKQNHALASLEPFENEPLSPHQMLRISQVITCFPIQSSQRHYVPFRKRNRFQNYPTAQKGNSRNKHCNSYINLLNFNINELGCLPQQVTA